MSFGECWPFCLGLNVVIDVKEGNSHVTSFYNKIWGPLSSICVHIEHSICAVTG